MNNGSIFVNFLVVPSMNRTGLILPAMCENFRSFMQNTCMSKSEGPGILIVRRSSST